jgi:predicted site-specific integrase-resolvase
MKVAALYARVSSAKQQLNENIASQIAAIQEYARQNDFQISPQHVYKDDGFSGSRLDRPALDRLRDAVAQSARVRPSRALNGFGSDDNIGSSFSKSGGDDFH